MYHCICLAWIFLHLVRRFLARTMLYGDALQGYACMEIPGKIYMLAWRCLARKSLHGDALHGDTFIPVFTKKPYQVAIIMCYNGLMISQIMVCCHKYLMGGRQVKMNDCKMLLLLIACFSLLSPTLFLKRGFHFSCHSWHHFSSENL